MINKNELRVGNKLYDIRNNVATVSSTYLNKYHVLILEKTSFKKFDVDVFGIKLTEEILFKCKFARIENRFFYYNDLKYIIEYDIENNLCFRIAINKEESCFVCELKYLHQLQNIFFAITETELEINL